MAVFPRPAWRLLSLAVLMSLGLAGCADLGTARQAYNEGDFTTARAHWEELADFGIPEAQTRLARMLLKGEGGQVDTDRAVALLQQAGDKNYAPALLDLGKLYQNGKVIPQNKAVARNLYERAWALRYTRAAYQLGLLSESEKNYKDSRHWYELAANAGDDKARAKLATLQN